MKKIETITREDRTIVQVGFNDDIRIDMQVKIKQLYKLQSPLKDFSKYYPFNIDQLSDWVNILDWESISSNKGVKWSDELIRKFKDKWHWFNLWLNQSVLRWDIKLLEEFVDKIAWDFILNTSIEWNKELQEKFEKYLPSHCNYEDIKNHTSTNRDRFKNKPYFNLSNSFQELYLYAKEIDDEQGIFILFDAIEIYLNSKVSIKNIKYNSSPL